MNAAGALLLAAGRGRRMGGPKAWLLKDGKALLERHLEFLAALFPPEALRVSIQAPWLDRCRGLEARAAWTAVDPDLSPLASLQTLLRVPAPRGWAFSHHVDMPVWEPELFEALDRRIPEADSRGFEALVPSWKTRKGHPLLLSPEAQDAILAADPAVDRLDHWLRGRKILVVDLPFPCVVENWNAPALTGSESFS